MLFSVILVIVILLLVYVCTVCHWKRRNYPPGPFPWPFIGNKSLLNRLTKEHGSQHNAFAELARHYRSEVFSIRVGRNNMIVISGKKLAHEVLNCEDYDGRPWNEFIKLRNMGMRKGITMNDGSDWKTARAWLVRTFRSVGFGQRKMLELIKYELVQVLDTLKSGGVRRMNQVLAPTVINVLWSMAAGKRLGEGVRLEHFLDLMERRARAFDMTGGILSIFPWIRYIAPETSGYNLLRTVNKEVVALLSETINEHMKVYRPGNEGDLIHLFLREMYNEKGPNPVFTHDQLVLILLDLFLAGIQTTMLTLDFLFLSITVHPEVQCKLHEELDRVIGPDRLPDLTDRPELPYTEAVLTESQRLWTVTPVIGPRRLLRDTKLLNYTIPKNTFVLLNIHANNTDPESYPDSHSFKPERFLKNGVYQSDENLILFGKGKRRCPGEVLAKSALFLMFAGVMHKNKLLPVPGQGPTKVEIVPGLTIAPKPYEVLVVPR